MKKTLLLSILLVLGVFAVHGEDIPTLENPISVQYIKKHLRKSHPRLGLTPSIEKNLKEKIKSDPMVASVYKAIRQNVDRIKGSDLLTRRMQGRRMLGTSRDMLHRVNMLGMVYRIEKDPVILDRLNGEVIAVCNFPDWNPSHFLDVGEMSLAVALALDWAGDDLPRSTVDLAMKALVEKGLKPGWQPELHGDVQWINIHHNWNQVCHCGLVAAAIAVAEREPELAAKTIKRALDNLPHALATYMPDGVYPEGPGYWGYGTEFSLILISMLESALGSDFGQAAYPGFMESPIFYMLSHAAPSGMIYDFADTGNDRRIHGNMPLAWFAAKTGNKMFLEEELFLKAPEQKRRLGRTAGMGLIWLSQFKEKENTKLPSAWMGDGSNPIAIFADDQFYLGCKGGHGSSNHGHIDAGSFIFELDGVRWAVELGNQDYHKLEAIGFNQWRVDQNSQRWLLLSKNNFGHSTLTVNNRLFDVDGHAVIENFTDGEQPQVTFDLTPVYGDLMTSAKRTFLRDGATSLTITDKLITSGKTEVVTWQLITTSDVELSGKDAILKQGRKTLKIENISHPACSFSVVSLCPAPMEIDAQIEGLKRLELRVPAWMLKDGKGEIKVRLYQ